MQLEIFLVEHFTWDHRLNKSKDTLTPTDYMPSIHSQTGDTLEDHNYHHLMFQLEIFLINSFTSDNILAQPISIFISTSDVLASVD